MVLETDVAGISAPMYSPAFQLILETPNFMYGVAPEDPVTIASLRSEVPDKSQAVSNTISDPISHAC